MSFIEAGFQIEVSTCFVELKIRLNQKILFLEQPLHDPLLTTSTVKRRKQKKIKEGDESNEKSQVQITP